MAEKIITALTHVSGLRVAARSASFQFRGSAVDVAAAGQHLVNATCLRALAGLKEQEIDTFERLVSLGWGRRDWVERDPDYDSLRDDPRFQRLLAQMK